MVRRPRTPRRRAGRPARRHQAARPRRRLRFGKSSALRAGLLAALRRDVLPGSASWPVVVLRPGPHPMAELARGALGQASRDDVDVLTDLVSRVDDDSGRLLVVVDQFEEVWTVCSDPAERRTVPRHPQRARHRPPIPRHGRRRGARRLLGEAAEHEAFRALLADGTVFLGPMTPAEIRRAVERPAAMGGLTLEDGLADTLVSDAGQEPGLLPLLSTAMTQLWERRDAGVLTYSAYVALGGLSGAISTLAEESYAALPPAQRGSARILLLRLTGPGDGAGVTRRRVPLTELEALPQRSIRNVVEDLARARLLTVSKGSVEVAHEALFREWPRLRGWLEEDAAGRAVQRRLALAASEWEDDGRDASTLWEGTRLASGLEVEESRPEELTSTERAFLAASQDAVDAAQRDAEERAAATARQNRRLRRLLVVIAGVLVLALVAGTLAWRSRQEARAASVSAEAQRLAATALTIEQPDLALLAAVEGTRLEQSPETYGALLTLLARQPRVVHRLRTPQQAVRIATSPDGAAVFLGFNGNRVGAVNAQTGQVRWTADLPAPGFIASVSATRDGRGVLVRRDGGRGLGGRPVRRGHGSGRVAGGRGGPGGRGARCDGQRHRGRLPGRRPLRRRHPLPRVHSGPRDRPGAVGGPVATAVPHRVPQGVAGRQGQPRRPGRARRRSRCRPSTPGTRDRPAGRPGAGRLTRCLPRARRPPDGGRVGPARRRRPQPEGPHQDGRGGRAGGDRRLEPGWHEGRGRGRERSAGPRPEQHGPATHHAGAQRPGRRPGLRGCEG